MLKRALCQLQQRKDFQLSFKLKYVLSIFYLFWVWTVINILVTFHFTIWKKKHYYLNISRSLAEQCVPFLMLSVNEATTAPSRIVNNLVQLFLFLISFKFISLNVWLPQLHFPSIFSCTVQYPILNFNLRRQSAANVNFFRTFYCNQFFFEMFVIWRYKNYQILKLLTYLFLILFLVLFWKSTFTTRFQFWDLYFFTCTSKR